MLLSSHAICTWSLDHYNYFFWYFVCSASAWLLQWEKGLPAEMLPAKKPFAHSQEIWGRTLFIVAVILRERCLITWDHNLSSSFLIQLSDESVLEQNSLQGSHETYADWFADPYNKFYLYFRTSLWDASRGWLLRFDVKRPTGDRGLACRP